MSTSCWSEEGVFVIPNISLVNISMVLIFWLKEAVPVCVMPLALIQTVVDHYFPDVSFGIDIFKNDQIEEKECLQKECHYKKSQKNQYIRNHMYLVFHISNTPCQRSRQLESHLKSRLALKLYNVIRFRCCTTG